MMVEDIFALAVALEIGGHGGDQRPAVLADDQRGRLPAGARPDAARIFQRGEEFVTDEGIVRPRERVPLVAIEGADRPADPRGEAAIAHGTPAPSAIGASAWRRACASSSGVFTVQVSTGMPPARREETIGLGKAAT